MSRPPDRVPPPSSILDEVQPTSGLGPGGLAGERTWYRGPCRLGHAIAGVEALAYPDIEPAGEPVRWRVPAVICAACADQTSHDNGEIYRPAKQYRQIAADFLRLQVAGDVLRFVETWGLIRSHKLGYDQGHHPPTQATWAERLAEMRHYDRPHDDRPDVIGDVLEWSSRAQRLHGQAFSFDDRERRRGFFEVAGVVRTMRLEFAAGDRLAVEAIPTTLLHYVFYALLGLYHGQRHLVCAENPWTGCVNELPQWSGRGRPPKYCSNECEWRASNRRRRTKPPTANAR